MLIQKAQTYVRSVRKRIVSEMKAIGLVKTPTIERVQSHDDYTLVTSSGYSGRYQNNQQSAYRNPRNANHLMKTGLHILMEPHLYE